MVMELRIMTFGAGFLGRCHVDVRERYAVQVRYRLPVNASPPGIQPPDRIGLVIEH